MGKSGRWLLARGSYIFRGADLTRQILLGTSGKPHSADVVRECWEASLPAVDRHVDDHESAGLLTEATQDDDKGTPYKTYAAAQSEQTVRLVSGELTSCAASYSTYSYIRSFIRPRPANTNSPSGMVNSSTSTVMSWLWTSWTCSYSSKSRS